MSRNFRHEMAGSHPDDSVAEALAKAMDEVSRDKNRLGSPGTIPWAYFYPSWGGWMVTSLAKASRPPVDILLRASTILYGDARGDLDGEEYQQFRDVAMRSYNYWREINAHRATVESGIP